MFYEMVLIFVVFICTLLYLIADELHSHILIWHAVSRVFIAISQVSYGYSMYLMMDHNIEHYVKFLKVVQTLKLHWLCCQWRYFVMEQLKEHDKELKILSMDSAVTNDNDQSQLEPKNASVQDHAIKMNELSLPTTTMIN